MRTLTGQNVPLTDKSDLVNYPYGRAVDETFTGAGNGTAASEKAGIGDSYQVMVELLRLAGMTPNESPEKKGSSQVIDALVDLMYPFGEIRSFGTETPPVVGEWVKADGRELSRTGYPKAFAAWGVTWGNGDGETTFNLPQYESRVGVGTSQSHDPYKWELGETGGSVLTTVAGHSHNPATALAVVGAFPGSDTAVKNEFVTSINPLGSFDVPIMQPFLALNYFVRVK